MGDHRDESFFLDVVWRNKAANFILYSLVFAIGVVILAVIVGLFKGLSVWPLVGLLAVNGGLGWGFGTVIRYLYPPICRDSDGNVHIRRQ